MNTNRLQHLIACLGFAALTGAASTAMAQTAPGLGSLDSHAVASGTLTNTAAGTVINGDVCFTTGPTVNPTVVGAYGPCPASAAADPTAALAILNTQPCTLLPAGNLDAVSIGGGPPGIIPPGCYERAGAINITANGVVILNGNGVYIFRSTGGAVTTGANSGVFLAGGACAGNVFWAPVGATTLGATSVFVGSILDAAGITLGLGANLNGRALAVGGTVTTNANTIGIPAACAALGPGAGPLPGSGIPTLSEWAMILLATLLALAGFAALRRRSR